MIKTPLHLFFISVSANTLHEHIQPLRISQNSDLAQSLSRNNSPPASLTNLENSRRTSQAKWMCQVRNISIWFQVIYIFDQIFEFFVIRL